MRRKRKLQVRAFSMMATVLMIFSLLTPGFVGAEKNGGNSVSLYNTNNTFESKAKNDLLEKFEKDEMVTFLIRFNQTADVKAAADKAKAKAEKANLSAYNLEIGQRSAVITELKTTAKSSQANVLEYLEEQVAKGNAKDLEAFYIVNGIAVTASKEVAEQIAKYSEVVEILPSQKYQLVDEVESNSMKESNATKEALQNLEWNVEQINAPDVWSLGYDGTGVVVANIDTGVQWNHPALKEKYAGYNPETGVVDHTYSFFDPVNGQTEPYDNDGHGTHTMGTMVGGDPDGTNQIGVAPGAKWIAVQAFTADGASDTDLFAAAEWILAPGGDVTKAPDVVNNSWSGGMGLNDWFREAVIAWRAANIFPAFAAGNVKASNPGGPESIAHPGSYPESFAVGATDSDDILADFSLRGPSPYGEIKPDISAPGVAIRSALPGNTYGISNGTSMAAPAVAGVVALLKSANDSLHVDQIEQILIDTAVPRTDNDYPVSPNNGYGHGIVDAFAAVATVASGLGTIEGTVTVDGEDTEAPAYTFNAPEKALDFRDLKLSIYVSDNVYVRDVTLRYGDKSIEATQVSGNQKAGYFEVNVPVEDLVNSFTYSWTIHDFGGNEVTTEDYTVEIVAPLLLEGFESEPIGWSLTTLGTGANSWEFGVPTASSGPTGAASGEKVAGTNLAGNYRNREISYLNVPAITLPEGSAYLSFDQWVNIETGRDYGYVVAKNDPEGEWQVLDDITGEKTQWDNVIYDISEFSGGEIYLAFLLETDSSVVRRGWYIDNVLVTDVPLGVNPLATAEVTNEMITPSSIPLDATISVLETGKSTKTNPLNGSFSMISEEGTYTVVADSYGYYQEEQTVEVTSDETVQANFVLEKIPMRQVSGTITDGKTGEPIEGATIYLVEDANVAPVVTDVFGQFNLTAYEGDYTLRVVVKDYHSKEVEISVYGDTTQEMSLDPFYTAPGSEISYDDGTPENARAMTLEGSGWAVKMSLPEGVDSGLVTDGVFQFHNKDWPNPGGTEFAVEVWSAGLDGMPDKKLAGPVTAEAIRDLSQWTVVDLREHKIQVEGDFFMVFVQTVPHPLSPGIATDENGDNTGRSYTYSNGKFSKVAYEQGNYMIRARIDNAVSNPVIDEEFDNLITNKETINVTGTATVNTELKLYKNGEEAGNAVVDDNRRFSLDVKLSEGENNLSAVSVVNGKETTQSKQETIVLDTVAPDLVASSTEGSVTNKDTVTIVGTASDEHFASVTVNGEKATVEADGSFAKRVLLDAGENELQVVATDLAGNSTSKAITVTADYDAPTIENLEPSGDLEVEPGDEVKISFTSDTEDGTASFMVQLPNQGNVLGSKFNNPMQEVEPGVYEGSWVVPDGEGSAKVVVGLTDTAGNTATQVAVGTLTISYERASRISGEIRYDTAMEISKQGFESADTVILARGSGFADALAGVPLAHRLDAPILLTPSHKLWDGVLAEVERLGAKNIIILGGKGAVSEEVAAELTAQDLQVSRIAGETRFETAALIAAEIAPNGIDQAVVVNGMDFPDALSVASYAANAGMPILLTKSDNLPEATVGTLRDLHVKKTLVVGGKSVVNADVLAALPNAERVSGQDRYETNIELANYFDISGTDVYVATGQHYADALTGAVLAAKNNRALVLVHQAVPNAARNFIEKNGVKRVTIFGGEAAVSSDVEVALVKLLP